jgi:hypothetical protein
MPRRRWRLAGRRGQLTPALREWLETGNPFTPAAHAAGEASKWGVVLELAAVHAEGQRRLWADHRDLILSAWLREHAGCRPWGWWLTDAPEPRRCLGGAEHLQSFGWREGFGIHAVSDHGHFTVTLESEAAYLARLGLLVPGERARLHRSDLAPEILTVDEDAPALGNAAGRVPADA